MAAASRPGSSAKAAVRLRPPTLEARGFPLRAIGPDLILLDEPLAGNTG